MSFTRLRSVRLTSEGSVESLDCQTLVCVFVESLDVCLCRICVWVLIYVFLTFKGLSVSGVWDVLSVGQVLGVFCLRFIDYLECVTVSGDLSSLFSVRLKSLGSRVSGV